MMYWSQYCKATILDNIRNEDIKRKMYVESSLTDTVEQKQVLGNGHMQRMEENRLSEKAYGN